MSRLLWFALVAVLAGGCGARTEAVDSSDIRVEVSTVPRAVAALRPVTLQVRCADRRGRPVTAQMIEARLSMPEMAHGEETVTLQPAGDGRYEAAHTFSMDGVWELEVHGVAAGKEFRTRVPIRIGPD